MAALVAVASYASVANCAADEPAAEKRDGVPSGYEDAPVAGEAAKAPARDWSRWGEFGKAAAILDEDVAANVRNVERSYLPRFMALVNVERSFLLRACRLNEEQQRRISEVTKVCAEVAARRYATARCRRVVGKQIVHRGPMRIIQPAAAGNGPVDPEVAAAQADPRGTVSRLLLSAVDEMLSAEQKTRFVEEDGRRKEYAKQAVISNYVVLFDEQLALTPRQRRQFVESLTKNWDPSWLASLSHLAGSSRYVPRIPDKHVLDFLTDSQKTQWQRLEKITFSSSGSFGPGRTPQRVIDDELAGEDVEEFQAGARLDILSGPAEVITVK